MSVIQRCSPLHKTYRKLYAQALHPRVVQADFAPLQERLARSLVKALLDDADQYVHHFHRYVISLLVHSGVGPSAYESIYSLGLPEK